MAHYSRDIHQSYTTETGPQELIYLQGNARATIRVEGGSSSDNINLQAVVVLTDPPVRDTLAVNILSSVTGNVWVQATNAPLVAVSIDIVANVSNSIKLSVRISEGA